MSIKNTPQFGAFDFLRQFLRGVIGLTPYPGDPSWNRTSIVDLEGLCPIR